MIKNILSTTFSRIINAVLMILVLLVATKNLGAAIYGSATLILLAITFIHIVNNMVGGSATVYFITRKSPIVIFVFAYLWAFFVAACGTCIFFYLGKIPLGYHYHVFFLVLLLSFATANQNILVGKERIFAFNIISVLQVTTLLAVLSYYIFIEKQIDLMSYVNALYAGYGMSFIISLMMVIKEVKSKKVYGIKDTVKSIMSYGSRTQIANVLQFFNYRLSFYILENYINRAALGVFGAGVQLSEGLWIVGKSVSLVQFSRTSNTEDRDYNNLLAINLVKLSFILTFVMLVVLLLFPTALFVYLFGADFTAVKIVILTLAPGIVIVPCSMIMTSYFSGIGKPQIGTYTSAIGLVITIVVGFSIIPIYGIIGAGITASVTYLLSFVYLFVKFKQSSGALLKDFMVRRDDIAYLLKEIKAGMSKNS